MTTHMITLYRLPNGQLGSLVEAEEHGAPIPVSIEIHPDEPDYGLDTDLITSAAMTECNQQTGGSA